MNDEEQKAKVVVHRRSPKGEKRRQLIIDAMLQELSVRGYNSASIVEVAKNVGITTAGLLHHFPTKEALLMAVLERQDEMMAEHFVFDEGQITLSSLFEKMRSVLCFAQGNYGLTLAQTILNTESLVPEHPAWSRFQERFNFIYKMNDATFKELIERGEMKPDIDPTALGAEIFSILDGLQIQWLRNPHKIDMVKVFDGYLQRLEKTIRN